MEVSRLTISNFRGIKESILHFNGHTLLIGSNNIGKSTICEALDLVLGPDRLNRYPVVEEHDFYNSIYLKEKTELVKIRIEVVLVNLTEEILTTYSNHLEFWNSKLQKVLSIGEINETNKATSGQCLRLEFIANYDVEEDEFTGKTFFSHSPDYEEGELAEVHKKIKRKIGFLYLRTLRTGTRALSLERGSLLDIILNLSEVKENLWEDVRQTLKNLNLNDSTKVLRPVLNKIEARVAEYIPIEAQGESSRVFVSQLTRDHLRKTLSFFLSISEDQHPVPFQGVGTGTLNALVLSLLSFIAELKKDNVIFAMEEPEIAMPPHTQRRIIKYLIESTSQSFVTSHSPYVIEKFSPEQVLLLNRSKDGSVTARSVESGSTLKPKNYRRQIRKAISEALLGKAVIVVEGLSELQALEKCTDIMESSDKDCYPLDLSGVTIFDSGGDGNLSEFGSFFKGCGLDTYAFYDKMKTRREEEKVAIKDNFVIPCETSFVGIENLVVKEISADVQWKFLEALRIGSKISNPSIIPEIRPLDDNKIFELTKQLTVDKKGEGRLFDLIEACNIDEIPVTIKNFLVSIYKLHPKPNIKVRSTVIESTPANSEEKVDAS